MDILFWSGGKDAFLALNFYRRQHSNRPLKLLTTYNKTSGIVPHQAVSIETIRAQANALELEINLVGLPRECPNELYLSNVQRALENQSEAVDYLVFGDWYLRDIRVWREEQFTKLDFECLFPIWKKSLDQLLDVLFSEPVEIRISAVQDEFEDAIRVGECYDQSFVRQLPQEIDPMGEKGEFHTELIFLREPL